MIKIFRNVRQNLLNEGKTTKYLQYALGEIVLVVIGILIALQINNLNEQQNEQNIAKTYMKGIIENLRYDIIRCDINMKNNSIGKMGKPQATRVSRNMPTNAFNF